MFSKFWFRKATSKKRFESRLLANTPAEEIQSHPSANPPTMNPATSFNMASRELSMFWRIENFSLLGLQNTCVISAPFTLRCGANLTNLQRFRITLHQNKQPCPDGTLKLSHLNQNLSQSEEPRLPDIRVSFSALLANGEYRMFHEGGLIRNGVKAESCEGQYEDCVFLINNRSSHLPNDSLTFLLQFKSEEPVFHVERLIACTRVPCEKVSFDWKIKHHSKDSYWRYVPSNRFELEFKTAQNLHEDVYDIFVRPPIGYSIGKTIACAIFLKKDSGEREVIQELAFIQPASNRFSLSREFCEKHARKSLKYFGSLTLCFQFRTSDATANRDFRETSTVEYVESQVTQTTRRPASRKESEANCPKYAIVDPGNAGDTGNAFSCANICKNIYLERIFSDFTLKVGDRAFPVHRCILSAWSDVFRAMFEADMFERRENRSEVTDVDADTMDRMLRFLYSTEFQDLDEDGASRLFVAADKYQIGPLRSRCVESLAAGLTAENVCRVLSLAENHSDRTLVARTKQFVIRNPDLVFQTNEWRRFMSENLEVASSLMHEAHLQRLE